jgi:hypothetical protein
MLGGGGSIRVSERRVGGPALRHFSGSAHQGSAGNVGNRTSRHQGIRRGRATRYLVHSDFRRSGFTGALAMGLGEPDDDGERGSRKSDEAGGQGGHRSILGGPRPRWIPYSGRMFPDDVLECFRTVSWGIPQRGGRPAARTRSNSASDLAEASAVASRSGGRFCRPGSSKPWLAPG